MISYDDAWVREILGTVGRWNGVHYDVAPHEMVAIHDYARGTKEGYIDAIELHVVNLRKRSFLKALHEAGADQATK